MKREKLSDHSADFEAGLRAGRPQEAARRIADLEAELARSHRIQGKITGELSRMCGCAYDLGGQLTALVDAFDAGDTEQIVAQLKAMSDRRRQARKPEVH